MNNSTGHPKVDAVSQIVFSEDTLFIPRWWRNLVVKASGYCDPEASVILADLINPYWIKNDQQEAIGVKQNWQTPTVITKKKFQEWQSIYCFSPKVSQKHLDRLMELDLLIKEELTSEQIKSIMTRKSPQSFNQFDIDIFNETCEWCQSTTAHLHGHHYPTPKKLGGTKVVSICPNCHSEFHSLEHIAAYSLTRKVLEDLS